MSSRGYNGPGIYRVTSPLGLTLHQGTSRKSFGYGKSKPGWTLEVLRDADNGWFEVRGDIEWFKWENPPSGHPMQRRDNPTTMGYVTGYVCGSCAEHSSGPGPWLVKVSQDPAPAPAPYIPQYRVPVDRVTFPSASKMSRIGAMRYDQIGLNAMNGMMSARALPTRFVMMGQDGSTFVANAAATAAGILVFLGVAAGAVALVYIFKGGLWALGTAVALGAGYYLWRALAVPAMSATANAANSVIAANPYGPVRQVFRQVPGGILGFMGEGFYQVTNPQGLGVYSGPTMSRPAIQMLAPGAMARVFAQSENNYVQIDQPTPGFVCMSCAEAPGGPWLVRKS